MTSQPEICEICSQPKASAMTGSFTQWVAACHCDQNSGRGIRLPVCAFCGKQIDKGNTGSFTEWVLQTERCVCENPIAIDPSISPSHPQGLPAVGEASAHRTLEDDLSELDAATFPLDRYQPLGKLGFGGTGSVFLCLDKHLKKNVAVKVAHAKLTEERDNFQAEARVTAKFKHPNIVSILDFGITQSGAPFMVLEHVAGLSLDKYVKERGRLQEGVAIPLFIQIASALEKGHESGIFHRDIKSSNIIITQSEKTGQAFAQVIDFGIAMSTQQTTAFNGKNIIGTPKYMSPDQLLGRPFDARSEVYSFGCVMYETLSGSLPFSGDALTLLDKHKEMTPPRFEELVPPVPVSLQMERIVRRCLEKDPELRFQTMTDLMIALHRANRHENIGNSSTFILNQSSIYPPGDSATEATSDQAKRSASDTTEHGVDLRLSTLIAGTLVVLILMVFSALKVVQSPALKSESERDMPATQSLDRQDTMGTAPGANILSEHMNGKSDFDQFMFQNAKNPDGCFKAAQYLSRRELWEFALQAIDKAISMKPTGAYYQFRADVQLHLGKDSEAIADCEKALEAGVKDATLYRSYGAALIGRKRYPEAEKALSEALRIEPKFLNPRILRATVYEFMHEDQKALADYTFILDQSPDELPSRERRAALYDRLGMKDLAERDRAKLPHTYNHLLDGVKDWDESINKNSNALEKQVIRETTPR